MEKHPIPQTLDAKPLALIFNATQIYCFFGAAIVGVAINHPFIAGAIGLVAGSFFNRFVDKRPDSFLRHMAYFYGIPVLRTRLPLNGLDREFRP